MTHPAKFRVQAGALLFEMEGDRDFIQQQMDLHRDHIELILEEQAKLIKSGKVPPLAVSRGRRGRPAGRRGTGRPGDVSRRPGRQPVIIRESSLQLKPRQLGKVVKYLASIADDGKLGKDATVYAIAYFLCTEVFNKDSFTAGDVNAVLNQLGGKPYLPEAKSIDVVQMLRNLAATSIGKEWVGRNLDGTFSITEKGKEIGVSGSIVRPRGRRPAASEAVAESEVPKVSAKAGRPPRKATTATARQEKPAARRMRKK